MKTCVDCDELDLGGVAAMFRKLVDAQVGLGGEVLKLIGAGASGAISCLGGGLNLPRIGSCCDIPDPCWMPKGAGEAHCCLAAGGTGEIRIVLTNEDRVSHTYSLEAAGFGANLVSFSTPNVTLGTKERTLIVATFAMPSAQTAQAVPYSVVVWVHGCHDHYFRWIVRVGARGKRCCYEVKLDDSPDNILHWYDHFYCPRSCAGSHVAGG